MRRDLGCADMLVIVSLVGGVLLGGQPFIHNVLLFLAVQGDAIPPRCKPPPTFSKPFPQSWSGDQVQWLR